MEALIPIGEGQFPVDARGLHAFLQSGERFADWIKDRVDRYGFSIDDDYEVFQETPKNPVAGRPSIEYRITLSMAKELSMVERNERGKQAWQYFIECERRYQQIAKPMALEDPIILQAQSVKELKIVVSEQGERLEMTERKLELVIEFLGKV